MHFVNKLGEFYINYNDGGIGLVHFADWLSFTWSITLSERSWDLTQSRSRPTTTST